MRTNKEYNISKEAIANLCNDAPVDTSKLPKAHKVVIEGGSIGDQIRVLKDVRESGDNQEPASGVIDELTEEEQRERYEEDMGRLEEEFQDSLLERRIGQAGVNPFTGGKHRCRYVDPNPTTVPALTLDDIRSVVRQEINQAIENLVQDYHFETKNDHNDNYGKRQAETQLKEMKAHDRIERFESLITRLEKVGK